MNQGLRASPLEKGADMAEDLQSKLVSYIRDAHAMERNVQQMLNSMILTTSDETIKERLQQHKEETVHQIQRLEKCLSNHDQDSSTLKDAGAVMGALAKGVQDSVRTDKPGKNARDGFVTENMEIAAYELLERLAQRAGDQETAQVARENRREEEAMREFFASNWDRVLDLTLEEEGVTG